MARLKDKIAVITGGAKGIGEADAVLFAEEGAKIVIADIDVDNGKKLSEKIKKEGGDAVFVKVDVTKEDDWKNLMAETKKNYGKINVLVNNAGVIVCKPFEEITLDDWNFMMSVNVTGVFLGTKYGIEAMKGNGDRCSIINRSSIAAMIGYGGMEAYCATKGAVRAFTKAAAMTCTDGGYTIRINSVHPGEVHTPMMEHEAEDYGLSLDEYIKQMSELHPMGFIGEPLDIAYIDLYLASDESRWVTGSEFVIDGGFLSH